MTESARWPESDSGPSRPKSSRVTFTRCPSSSWKKSEAKCRDMWTCFVLSRHFETTIDSHFLVQKAQSCTKLNRFRSSFCTEKMFFWSIFWCGGRKCEIAEVRAQLLYTLNKIPPHRPTLNTLPRWSMGIPESRRECPPWCSWQSLQQASVVSLRSYTWNTPSHSP